MGNDSANVPDGAGRTSTQGRSGCCSSPPAAPSDDCCPGQGTGCCAAASDGRAPQGSGCPPVIGWLETPAGRVPRVPASLTWCDRLGAAAVRLRISRMSYAVGPGLYAVGDPTADSPVLATANYKLSFDSLRKELAGVDAWILVLDTHGINVWCAAGGGLFSTDEVVRSVEETGLARVVAHRVLVLPQLGAPGVAAGKVRDRCGFRVTYGPVRAADVPAFLDAGMRATPAMRRVRFTLGDRVVLIPVEAVGAAPYGFLAAACLFLVAGIGGDGYSIARAAADGGRAAGFFLLGYTCGTVLTPALLPWLPGRSFSLKGACVGTAAVLCCLLSGCLGFGDPGRAAEALGWLLIVPASSAFLGMNFTGASTYTSLSGVRKEMRRALPLQIAGGVAGLALWLTARFI